MAKMKIKTVQCEGWTSKGKRCQQKVDPVKHPDHICGLCLGKVESDLLQAPESNGPTLLQQAADGRAKVADGGVACGLMWPMLWPSCEHVVRGPNWEHAEHRWTMADENSIYRSVAENPTLDSEALARLEQDSVTLRDSLVDPVDSKEAKAVAAIRAAVASHTNCSADTLRNVIDHHRSTWELEAALANPRCPQEQMVRFQDYPYSTGVQVAIAGNPGCPPEVLGKMIWEGWKRTDGQSKAEREAIDAKDEETAKDILVAAARNPACTEKQLEFLVRKNHPWTVRWSAVNNPSCSPEMLNRLAHDPSLAVAKLVAQAPGCPPSGLEHLAKHKREIVRLRVANNPSTPIATLQELLGDEDERVRQSAWANPSLPETYRQLRQIRSA
jgi:hypothetical protein